MYGLSISVGSAFKGKQLNLEYRVSLDMYQKVNSLVQPCAGMLTTSASCGV